MRRGFATTHRLPVIDPAMSYETHIRELAEDIYRERVLRARRTPPAEKFMDGARLFDMACRVMMDGIRHEHPGADEQRVRQLLMERIELGRRLEALP